MNPTTTLARPRPARPAAVAILYPKVGKVLRVPLRRTRTGGAHGCAQHPERQFIAWFNRMAGARPGFPTQIKSVLLITGEPLCRRCHQALANYLSRYHLAGKLRLRAKASAQPAGSCGCRTPHPAAANRVVQALLMDDFIAESELEQEGWWERAKDWGRAALVGGALLLPAQGPLKPVRDAITAYGNAHAQRRKIQQTVDDNTPKSSRRPGGQELGELESSSVLASVLPPESEQESIGTMVIHPNIDVHAQYSLQRLLSSPDPAAQGDGDRLLNAVRTGESRGIYKVDQRVPALWAKEDGAGWWELLEPADDAAVLLWSYPPYAALWPPMVVFRDNIRSNAARLDPALRRVAQVLRAVAARRKANPQLTPWQLKSMITGQPLPNQLPSGRMAAIIRIGKA